MSQLRHLLICPSPDRPCPNVINAVLSALHCTDLGRSSQLCDQSWKCRLPDEEYWCSAMYDVLARSVPGRPCFAEVLCEWFSGFQCFSVSYRGYHYLTYQAMNLMVGFQKIHLLWRQAFSVRKCCRVWQVLLLSYFEIHGYKTVWRSNVLPKYIWLRVIVGRKCRIPVKWYLEVPRHIHEMACLSLSLKLLEHHKWNKTYLIAQDLVVLLQDSACISQRLWCSIGWVLP